MNKVFLTITLVIGLILVGCSNKSTVTDGNGYKYQQITAASSSTTNGIIQDAVWQRISPLDTNHWYTPTLSYLQNTNSIPSFLPLAK